MFVTERHRLKAGNADSRDIRRAIDRRDSRNDDANKDDAAKNTDSGNGVRAGMKYLSHQPQPIRPSTIPCPGCNYILKETHGAAQDCEYQTDQTQSQANKWDNDEHTQSQNNQQDSGSQWIEARENGLGLKSTR